MDALHDALCAKSILHCTYLGMDMDETLALMSPALL